MCIYIYTSQLPCPPNGPLALLSFFQNLWTWGSGNQSWPRPSPNVEPQWHHFGRDWSLSPNLKCHFFSTWNSTSVFSACLFLPLMLGSLSPTLFIYSIEQLKPLRWVERKQEEKKRTEQHPFFRICIYIYTYIYMYTHVMFDPQTWSLLSHVCSLSSQVLRSGVRLVRTLFLGNLP